VAKVTMPQLGESVAEGTIGRWLKKPGDRVEKYEPIVEVVTDKVNAEVPSPFAGILTAILAEEGAVVPNNAVSRRSRRPKPPRRQTPRPRRPRRRRPLRPRPPPRPRRPRKLRRDRWFGPRLRTRHLPQRGRPSRRPATPTRA